MALQFGEIEAFGAWAIDAKRFQINYFVIANECRANANFIKTEIDDDLRRRFSIPTDSMFCISKSMCYSSNPKRLHWMTTNGRTSVSCAGNVMEFRNSVMHSIRSLVCVKIIFIWISLSCYLDTVSPRWPHTQTKGSLLKKKLSRGFEKRRWLNNWQMNV